MGTILAVINQKGGAGKSTTTINVAAELVTRGYRVAIVDTDPQAISSKWYAMRDDGKKDDLTINFIGEMYANIVPAAKDYAKTYDVVLIDGAGNVSEPLAHTIKVADAVIIPCQPSPADLWGTDGAVSLIQARHTVTDGLPLTAFVVTQAKKGTKLTGEIDSALLQFGLPVFDTHIRDLEIYKTSLKTGVGVVELDSTSEAAGEIRRLVDEMITNHFIKAK